jgi:general secretion pathway protein F
MPRFPYKARDKAGQVVEASVEAPSRKDALRLLTARGLSVTTITETGAAPARPARSQRQGPAAAAPADASFMSVAGGAGTPRRAERLPFLEALHDLTTSGLSAGEAVRLLSVRLKEPRLRTLSGGLWARLSEGAPLSRAMGEFPEVFDQATINLIHAGEATGSLNDTLARQIKYLTEQKELRRQMAAAMAYPIFMVFMSGGVILFFLFFLLPRLKALLTSLHGTMPLSTRILVGISSFALHYGLFVAIGAAALAVIAWRWRSTPGGRAQSDAWLIRLPLVGPFVVSQTVLAFSQTLSVLLENGITASDALRMTERQIVNESHRQAFGGAIERVMEGEALSSALGKTGCFPDLVLDRLAVGENTGNVVPALKNIAIAYQKQITNQLNLFTLWISSSVLTCVFVFVGFIAFAIVSAVFQVSASFKMGG